MSDMSDDFIEFEAAPGMPLKQIAEIAAAMALETDMTVFVHFSEITLEIEPGATVPDILAGYASARAQTELEKSGREEQEE